MSRDHRKLRAWELADRYAFLVYRATRRFPKNEEYGMKSQLRRAALSVPINIVEGCGRRTESEYLNFLNIAFGSLREAGYICDFAKREGYFNAEEIVEIENVFTRTSGTLGALIAALERKRPKP